MPHNQPPKPTTPPSNEGHRSKLPAALAVATLALPGVAQAAPVVPVEQIGNISPMAELTAGSTANPNPAAEAVAKAEPAKLTWIDTHTVHQQWSPDYDGKTMGALTDPTQMKKIVARIERDQKEGRSIKKITLEGLASDDDKSVDAQGQPTAGLHQVSADNLKGAEGRSESLRDGIVHGLKENGDPVPEIEIGEPKEILLSESEITKLEGLAKDYKYGDKVAMIQAYNRGETVPDEVKQALDMALEDNRGTTIVTEYEETLQPAEPAVKIDAPEPEQQPADDVLPVTHDLPLVTPAQMVAFTGDPVTRKDAAFKQKSYADTTKKGNGPTQRIKQIRPHSQHGTTGVNRHVVRDRGGSRVRANRKSAPRRAFKF